MSSLKRFFRTYIDVLKLAYQIHPGMLITLTAANLLWGLSNLPILYINKALIDLVISAIGHSDWQKYLKVLILLIVLRTLVDIVRGILSRINNQMSYSFGSLMSDRIGIILGEKLNSLDVPTVEDPNFQDKYRKVERESNNRIWGMLASLQEMPNAVTTIISGAVPLLSFNPIIAILVLLSAIPDAFVSAHLTKLDFKVKDERRRQYRILGRLSWLASDIQQFYENKVSSNIGYLSNKIRSIQDDLFNMDFSMRKRRIQWRTLTDVPDWLLSFGLYLYFFVLAIMGKITLGLAQMLYQSSSTLSNGTGMLLNNVATIYEHYLFVQDFNWFMQLQPSFADGKIKLTTPFVSGIEFDHVWFKYPKGDWILKDVSFSLGPTENLALVGENGAGKTTLLKLLLGFYKPQKGTIKVNGRDIFDYRQFDYWKQISILPQDFLLFPFSARESIAFSDLSRADNLSEIRHAATQVNIDKYLSGLPEGYATPLTKDLDGVEPSGGQKQRIAIARTLFKKSALMILDEPTSNVDPKAEEDIFKNVLRVTKNQVVILVSHRFSTVRKADKIILLEHGSIIEQGTHSDLIKQRGKYANLFNLQAKSYK